MAIFRNIHISFWEDSKVQEEMNINEKYFFLYLLTNPHTSQIGCYEITIRQMQYETGLDKSEIEKYLDRFEKELGIIEYSKTTKELLIKNWYKYNFTKSPKMFAYIKKEMQNIKHIPYKTYLDTVCIPYIYGNAIRIRKEQEQEQEKEQEGEEKKSDGCVDGSFQSDSCVDGIVKFYEENIGMITPHEFEVLDSYRADFNDDVIIYALKLQVEKRATGVAYSKAILNNWKKQNIKTLIEAQNENRKNVAEKSSAANNTYHGDESNQYSNLDRFYMN